MGPCRFSVIWLEFSIWQTLHQGRHSMVDTHWWCVHMADTFLRGLWSLRCTSKRKSRHGTEQQQGPTRSVRFGRRRFWSTHVNQKWSISLLICLEATKLVFLSAFSLIETICWKFGLNHAPRLQKGYFRLTCRVAQADVTRDDSQRRFLAQHCFEYLQHCSNIATKCCAKSRRCESSRVTSPLSSLVQHTENCLH